MKKSNQFSPFFNTQYLMILLVRGAKPATSNVTFMWSILNQSLFIRNSSYLDISISIWH